MLLFVVLGANGCKTSISEADLTQREAMQYYHQSNHIDYTDNYSR